MAFQHPQLVSVHWRVLEDMRQIARNALVGVAGHVVLKARLEIIGQHVLFRLEMAVKRLPGHFGLLAKRRPPRRTGSGCSGSFEELRIKIGCGILESTLQTMKHEP